MPATLALTFDDGPNPDATPQILALLEAHGAQATFFVWGERAREHPGVVREIHDAGHTVAPHCFEHVSHWSRTREQIAADIDSVTALLGEIGVHPAKLWRPPYGQLLRGASREVAADRGLELAGWTINPHDYAGHDAAEMLAGLRGALPAQGQAVLLLHDGHREPHARKRRPDAGNTVALVRMLLADAELRFASMAGGLEGSLVEGPPTDL